MKPVVVLFFALVAWMSLPSCTSAPARYIDLNTGLAFDLVTDPKTGLLVDKETGKPLNIYVDTHTRDTVWGRTGKIINGRLLKVANGGYAYEDDRSTSALRALAVAASQPALAGSRAKTGTEMKGYRSDGNKINKGRITGDVSEKGSENEIRSVQ